MNRSNPYEISLQLNRSGLDKATSFDGLFVAAAMGNLLEQVTRFIE